jgi:hypothetical protein
MGHKPAPKIGAHLFLGLSFLLGEVHEPHVCHTYVAVKPSPYSIGVMSEDPVQDLCVMIKVSDFELARRRAE